MILRSIQECFINESLFAVGKKGNDVLKKTNKVVANQSAIFDQLTFENVAEIAESMACRGSIKAGDELGEKEMQILLRDLSKCENPFHCPHGRPILVEMSYKELYKKFDRVYKRQD